jgi:hypothetical protein
MEKQHNLSVEPRLLDNATTPVLHLVGTLQGERREVCWGDRHAALTPKCFKFLAKLAVTAAVQPDRWVCRDELERGENQARYLYRLKGELEAQCGEVPVLWENNRRGAYRLTLPPQQIHISWDTLELFDDYDLVAWVREFRPEATSRDRLSLPGPSNAQVAA